MLPLDLVITIAIGLVLLAVLALYGVFLIGFVQDWALAKRPGHPSRRLARFFNRRARGKEERVVRAAEALHRGPGATMYK